MSEISKPKVNKLHQTMQRLGRRAWNARPQKTDGTNGWERAGNIAGNVLMTGASGLAWGGWLVSWLATKFLADNPGLDKLEKEFGKMSTLKKTRDGGYKESDVRKFLKKNPRLASYLSYYMMLATMFGGAALAAEANDNGQDDEANTKKEVVVSPTEQHDAGTESGATISLEDAVVPPANKKIPMPNPEINLISTNAMKYDAHADASKSVKEMVKEYFVPIAVGITELETYRETPKVHSGEKRATNGPGLTWYYLYDNKGILRQYANIPGKTKTRDHDGNYEQARRHLEYETFPNIRRALTGKNNIVKRHVIAAALAGYQRPADIAGIINKIENAETAQQVADAFKVKKNVSTANGTDVWAGTMKRRWWCAAIACGLISPEDFLDMPRDAFSTIELNLVYNETTGHFKLDRATVQYALSATRSKSTCRAFLSEFGTGRDVLKGMHSAPQHATADNTLEQSVTKQESAAIDLLIQGDKAYRKKNYDGAVSLYQQAINTDKDNMAAYSSLALAYKKLGDQKKSIDCYQKCCDVVKQANNRMNKNRHLLYDPDVKAATYYNAGLAREAMADLQLAAGNKADAKKNYARAHKNFDNAIYNVNMGDKDQARIETYEVAKKRVEKKQKDKKIIAFEHGNIKVKHKSDMIETLRNVADKSMG